MISKTVNKLYAYLNIFMIIQGCFTSSQTKTKHKRLVCYYERSYDRRKSPLGSFGKVIIDYKCNRVKFLHSLQCIRRVQVYQISESDANGGNNTTVIQRSSLKSATDENDPKYKNFNFQILHNPYTGLYKISLYRTLRLYNTSKVEIHKSLTWSSSDESKVYFDLNVSLPIIHDNKKFNVISITIPLEAYFSQKSGSVVFGESTRWQIDRSKLFLLDRNFTKISCSSPDDSKNNEKMKKKDSSNLKGISRAIEKAINTYEVIQNGEDKENANVLIVPDYVYEFFNSKEELMKSLIQSDIKLTKDLSESNAYLFYTIATDFTVVDKKVYGQLNEYYKINSFIEDKQKEILENNEELKKYKNYMETMIKVNDERITSKKIKRKYFK